jgi:hypothetical protein
LTERDGGGLEPAAAVLARRNILPGLEPRQHRSDRHAHLATETDRFEIGAVQLQHATAAGPLVKPVDVLRDHREQATRGLELRQRPVGGIGLGRQHGGNGGSLVAPVLAPRLVAGEELLVLDRSKALPHPARAAEVGNAGFGAEPRAREGHNTLRAA